MDIHDRRLAILRAYLSYADGRMLGDSLGSGGFLCVVENEGEVRVQSFKSDSLLFFVAYISWLEVNQTEFLNSQASGWVAHGLPAFFLVFILYVYPCAHQGVLCCWWLAFGSAASFCLKKILNPERRIRRGKGDINAKTTSQRKRRESYDLGFYGKYKIPLCVSPSLRSIKTQNIDQKCGGICRSCCCWLFSFL